LQPTSVLVKLILAIRVWLDRVVVVIPCHLFLLRYEARRR
jgi:hypothetical protein